MHADCAAVVLCHMYDIAQYHYNTPTLVVWSLSLFGDLLEFFEWTPYCTCPKANKRKYVYVSIYMQVGRLQDLGQPQINLVV